MQWAGRRKRCNDESDCVFLGKAFTGHCSQRDASIPTIQPRPSPQSTGETSAEGISEPGASLVKLYVEIKNDKSAEPIKILMKESIASSAVDSLRDSHELAHELSKSMILNYLNDPETVNVVMGITKAYLTDRATRSLLEDYLASYLKTDQVRSFYKYQVNITRDYYCLPNALGRSASDKALLDLLVWWVGQPVNISSVVVPLLEWTLLLDYVRASSAEIAADSLQYTMVRKTPLFSFRLRFVFAYVETCASVQDTLAETLAYSAIEALKSEENKKLVKDSIVDFLLSKTR
jgi:hypothetical protein